MEHNFVRLVQNGAFSFKTATIGTTDSQMHQLGIVL